MRTRTIQLISLFAFFFLTSPVLASRLINGTVVTEGYDHVVWIVSGGAGCTATVVGPRTILTAGHCASTGQTAKFKIGGTEYSAKITRHPDYNDSNVENDLALGLTNVDIVVKERSTISKTAPKVGDAITLLGYGCTKPNGQVDGKLRKGDSVITKFQGKDMGSHKESGATLCPGDSGGPAYISVGGKDYLAGVNSTVTVDYHTSYDERTDVPTAQQFFSNYAQSNGVKICGVNEDCQGTTPTAPTCQLAASPSTINKGQSITFTMNVLGEVTSADIGGVAVTAPNWAMTTTPPNAGNFTQTGKVTGPGGSNTCTAAYEVKGDPTPTNPTCEIAANPSQIKIGNSTLLTLKAKGNVTQAAINGMNVSFPEGSLSVQGTIKGQQQATGFVAGPGGVGTCQTTFNVDDGTQPVIPPYAVVPSYCGPNTAPNSSVMKACLGVIKRDGTQGLREAVKVTYADGSEEVLPLVAKTRNNSAVIEDALTLYANSSYQKDQYWVLNSRVGRVTYNANNTPVTLEGTTAGGELFSVSQLQP